MAERQQYDPNVIIQAADDKLAQDDLAGGQMIFQSALLDWVDDAREQLHQQQQQLQHGTAAATDPEQMREAIATLWVAYAHFLIKAKQYKSATEAYEQAVVCPIAGGVGRVWLDYARFAEERGKVRTAQNIYLRALVGTTSSLASSSSNADPMTAAAVTDEQDRYLLWGEFLEMMRKHNDPNLTMEELQTAVESEHVAASAAIFNNQQQQQQQEEVPDHVVSSTSQFTSSEYFDAPPSKRPKLEDAIMTTSTSRTTSPHLMQQPQQLNSHVVTAEAIEMEKAELLEMTQPGAMPPEITGAWMLRDGTDLASIPEPPLFSSSPPKLSDTSGRDILGDEVALALIQRLLEKSGSIVLQVCQGLWMLTALKEKESAKAIEMLDQSMTTNMERLEANLEARASVAGAAATAVAQVNERERSSFLQDCQQQRQQLLQGIAWEFRQLLCQQQQILTKLKIPGFDGPTVDNASLELQASVCSCLHSAFYLRSRVGQESHVKMLKSQEERFKRELSTSPKQGSRTPPGSRSPMVRPAGHTTANSSAPTPPPLMHYNMFPPSASSHPVPQQPMQALQPQLLPAMYLVGQQQQQQLIQPVAPAYFHYNMQQQPPPPHPSTATLPGAPPTHPSFGQYPPQQYF